MSGPRSLEELLRIYTAWSGRNVLDQAARRAESDGDLDRAGALRALAGDGARAPSAVEALAAQHEIASLLAGWQWQTVAAARDAGASWAELGQVLRQDPDQARRDYLAHVEDQARYRPDDDPEVARWRAAAGLDLSDGASPSTDEAVPRSSVSDTELRGSADTMSTDDQPTPPESIAASAADADDAVTLADQTDARMRADSAGDGQGPEFDLDRLNEVTEQFGYAVFDPAAPGGVRAPTATEYAQLLAELAPTTEDRAVHERGVDHAGDDARVQDPTSTDRPVGFDAAERQVDDVLARTADPDFPFDPSAEWGDAAYREPRTQDEADARTAHLEQLHALDPPGPPPGVRPLTETEDALEAALEDATLADRAHDPDPGAWNRVANLEALTTLQPLPASAAQTREHHGPEVDAEDALFRRGLDQHLPADMPGRDELIEDAVTVARDRFWTHFQTTEPQQALDLARQQRDDQQRDDQQRDDQQRDDQQPAAAEGRGDVPVESDVDREIADAYDRGPWTDERGRQWASLGEWAAATALESQAREAAGRPARPDDPAEIARRLDDARARLTARHDASAAEQAGVDEQRRVQLNHWSADDRHHDSTKAGAQDEGRYLDCRLHALDQPEDDR